ncbi:MAG: CDP-alcohol phosphatidyltransferase family protein [Candidatus Contendobacter sp.]|nr:CDP-alcohol phosphatidyltransferase family protein [Candidatus Contendobacter sp.]MDS4060009.1 CDP-alcohol phosphatidyltransferase family protein [Candidatus Contendobacter sp.]
MITLYGLKPRFQNWLRPVARGLHARGISANQVTLAALALAVVVAGTIWLWPTPTTLLLLPPVLFLRMALNALDGMLAREFQRSTPLGAVLNELGDVLADAVLYLPLVLIPGIPVAPVVALALLALLSEFCGVTATQIGASRRYDGPLGKSDRALLLGGIAVLLGCGVPAGFWLAVTLWVANGLLILTCVNRLRAALREVTPCPSR